MFRRIRGFFQDMVSEFKRVNWPSPRATGHFTVVVVIITAVFIVYMGLVDLGLSEAVKRVIQP